MKKALLLLAVVSALLAVTSPALAASPSAVYRTKVNGICKVGIAKLNAIAAPTSPKGYATYFDTQGRLGYALLKQIVAVKPPKSLQPLVLNALRPQGKVVDGLLALAATIRKGTDPTKAYNAAVPGLNRLSKQANTAWRKAGLNACAG